MSTGKDATVEGAASTATREGWPGNRAGSLTGQCEQEARFNFREGKYPEMGLRMARTHWLFRINLILAYWLLHLFLDPGSPVIPEGGWSALQTGVVVLRKGQTSRDETGETERQ